MQNTNIYSESERMLKYAEDVEVDYSKSNNDKNLFLVGLEYPDSISFDEFLALNTLQEQLEENEYVKEIRSIFNDKRVEWNKNIEPLFKVLSLDLSNPSNGKTLLDAQANALTHRQQINEQINFFLNKRSRESTKIKKLSQHGAYEDLQSHANASLDAHKRSVSTPDLLGHLVH